MARSSDRALDRAITALLHEAVEHSRAMRQVLNQVGQLASARINAISDEEHENPSDDAIAEVLSSLTKREKEVLDHLARGWSNRQIGRALGISERTVKNHLRNIFTKLHVSDRTSAVVKLLGHHD
ncbi:response regulator transcription factor [Saccharopolyspora sp. TS4A08]|uniref:Response regulator transcription factor n=1 Tax=Saccharopolyspora ipomoeae TaxID=3042027 RepID=A0ABT6PQI1_9PSEU|nr:response regulator transcription factor [Saccharopolyspora sp. TS4A08]MDI2030105.1 response regulator transcription factor [Saccharopolyspora sp. TS4A08]